MQWILLAPGPSMSQALADSVRGHKVGLVTSALPLAPWADFLAATDASWWRKTPEAAQFAGRKFSGARVEGVEQVGVSSATNSGVLALECAKRLGATRVLLLGFDMGLGHYFGNYTNGLGNTTTGRRRVHHVQYEQWAKQNSDIEVINATPGSALRCFPTARIEDCLRPLADERPARTNTSFVLSLSC